jgi:hypothetical protein
MVSDPVKIVKVFAAVIAMLVVSQVTQINMRQESAAGMLPRLNGPLGFQG